MVITEDGRPLHTGGPAGTGAGAGRRTTLLSRMLAAAGYSRQPRNAVVFREYAPRVWQWLRREVYGVSSESYISSMGGCEGGTGEVSPAQHQFSEAKGGGFFFFSVDRRYMVKTMDAVEHRTLLQILPGLCRHMQACTYIYNMHAAGAVPPPAVPRG